MALWQAVEELPAAVIRKPYFGGGGKRNWISASISASLRCRLGIIVAGFRLAGSRSQLCK